jgi:protein-arginine kinase activator protein McsA
LKTYIVEENIKDWLVIHREDLFDDILEECENALSEDTNRVPVALIRSMHGVTIFNLPSPDDVVKSLTKAMNDFVEREEYEKAARARDCVHAWEQRKEYIKKKG